ncbi:Imm52 family immunity protein [uncultured Paracoccus sp.]|uniref:Imm52 family immunity protein n=1 Tax=uncultured Paracoccus sp. TaxID=189685 RepID=UPI0025E600E2|nr:Imm52 family immunity protein [uncultured Paracoccus sp.]
MRIDLALDVDLPPQNYGFEEGAADFIALLTQLRGVRGFDVDWAMQPERDGALYSIWHNRNDYLEIFRKNNAEKEDRFSLWAPESSDEMLYVFTYRWNGWSLDHLSGEVYRPHPQYGTQFQLYVGLIDAIVAWKRPQHLAFGPGVYMRDHHPLDRSRAGIRWIGWVPFALNPSDVPEAEIVQPMHGGTLIATQSQYWQAWEANPDYSREAIERAQEVEIRLNLLGVLPTSLELQRGDWGQ